MTAAPLADVTDPRFTDDQRAVVARFDAAVTPPEVVEARVVEEVARAIHDAARGANQCAFAWPCATANENRRLAAAAVAAYRAAQDGGAEETVRRVEALAYDLESVARGYRHAASGTHDAGARNAHMAIAIRIRAALAPQAGDGAR